MVKRWTSLTLLIRSLSLGGPGQSGSADVMRGHFHCAISLLLSLPVFCEGVLRRSFCCTTMRLMQLVELNLHMMTLAISVKESIEDPWRS